MMTGEKEKSPFQNNTYPRDQCIHQIFETIAETFPEKTALVCKNKHWSYAKLNERANQLAHYLIDHGCSHENPVGISLARSIESLVALLAILKAGGAYVPLDTDNLPQERLDFILKDTAIQSVIERQGCLPLGPKLHLAAHRERRPAALEEEVEARVAQDHGPLRVERDLFGCEVGAELEHERLGLDHAFELQRGRAHSHGPGQVVRQE